MTSAFHDSTSPHSETKSLDFETGSQGLNKALKHCIPGCHVPNEGKNLLHKIRRWVLVTDQDTGPTSDHVRALVQDLLNKKFLSATPDLGSLPGKMAHRIFVNWSHREGEWFGERFAGPFCGLTKIRFGLGAI